MSQRDAGILRDARLHFENAHQMSSRAALPDPGWRWESYCIAARRLFGRYKTPLQAIHYIQAPSSNSGFEARFVGEALSKHVETMERNCLETFPQFANKLASFCETGLSSGKLLRNAMEGWLVVRSIITFYIRCDVFPCIRKQLESSKWVEVMARRAVSG